MNLSDFFRSIFGPFKEQLCPDDLPRYVFSKMFPFLKTKNSNKQPAINPGSHRFHFLEIFSCCSRILELYE